MGTISNMAASLQITNKYDVTSHMFPYPDQLNFHSSVRN